MNPAIDLKIDLNKQMARTFVASKGRLPKDEYELMEWLMEFTKHMADLCDHWQTLYETHLMQCIRPIVFPPQ